MFEWCYRNGKVIFVLLIIFYWNLNVLIFGMGDFGICLDKNGERFFMFEVLLGYGWDNFVNENCGVVVYFNYLKCKMIEDRCYFFLDELVIFFIKVS